MKERTAGQGLNDRLFDLGKGDTDPLSWQEKALCAQIEPDAFYPEKGGSTREAKKVCSACGVKGECLDYAIANNERFGVWGGLSERERRRLKKQQDGFPYPEEG